MPEASAALFFFPVFFWENEIFILSSSPVDLRFYRLTFSPGTSRRCAR